MPDLTTAELDYVKLIVGPHDRGEAEYKQLFKFNYPKKKGKDEDGNEIEIDADNENEEAMELRVLKFLVMGITTRKICEYVQEGSEEYSENSFQEIREFVDRKRSLTHDGIMSHLHWRVVNWGTRGTPKEVFSTQKVYAKFVWGLKEKSPNPWKAPVPKRVNGE